MLLHTLGARAGPDKTRAAGIFKVPLTVVPLPCGHKLSSLAKFFLHSCGAWGYLAT